MATRKMSWTRCGDNGDIECEVEVSISGRHVRATRLDPEEFPEIEIESVRVDATGQDILGTMSSHEVELLVEMAADHFGDMDEDAAAAQAEDAWEASRDR